MGKTNFLGKAKHYAEKIRRLNDYGHGTGYEQARRYLGMLGDVMKSASDHNSSDVALIHSIYVDMKKMIDEWEEEKEGHGAGR